MEFTREDLMVPAVTHCALADKDAVDDILIPWHQALTGDILPREKTFDVPVRTIGSQSQTHCLCFNTYPWSYWDALSAGRVEFSVLTVLEISLYTDYMEKYNLETINIEDHNRYLQLQEQLITDTIKIRKKQQEEKIRANMKILKEL